MSWINRAYGRRGPSESSVVAIFSILKLKLEELGFIQTLGKQLFLLGEIPLKLSDEIEIFRSTLSILVSDL